MEHGVPASRPGYIGRSKVILKGRGILGPELKLAIGAAFVLLVPTILYDSTVLPWLISRWTGFVALALILIPLQLCIGILFVRTALSDPGIVPRQVDRLQNEESRNWFLKIQPLNPPKHQDVVIQGHLFKMKYCATCNFYRPPRCVHCSICDNCVDRFDHHCPWVGNCVGRRNYRSFMAFIIVTSVYVLLVCITSPIKFFVDLQDLRNESGSYSSAFKSIFKNSWDAALLSLLGLGFLWFLLGLTGYHTYLVVTNQTTYEQLKGYFDDRYNPWDRGAFRNFRDLFLQRRRPRFITRSSERQIMIYDEFFRGDDLLFASPGTGRVESGGTFSRQLPLKSRTSWKSPSSDFISSEFSTATSKVRHKKVDDELVDSAIRRTAVPPTIRPQALHLASAPSFVSSCNQDRSCLPKKQEDTSGEDRETGLEEEAEEEDCWASLEEDDSSSLTSRILIKVLRPLAIWGRNNINQSMLVKWICVVPPTQIDQ